jgi:hypothetical protein
MRALRERPRVIAAKLPLAVGGLLASAHTR